MSNRVQTYIVIRALKDISVNLSFLVIAELEASHVFRKQCEIYCQIICLHAFSALFYILFLTQGLYANFQVVQYSTTSGVHNDSKASNT